MADDGESTSAEPIRFRSGMKRKAYRHRLLDDANADRDDSTAPPPVPPNDASNDEGEADDGEDAAAEDSGPVAAALRLRNASRRTGGRLRGVGFRPECQPSDNPQQALILPDGADTAVAGIDSRFMHQTGLLTILDDVHMNAFIESRLASRSLAHDASSGPDDRTSPDAPRLIGGAPAAPVPANRPKDHQPARHGKLFEVAIPEDMRRIRDDERRRRVEKPPPAVRRPRSLRNDDDVMRDNLVDQFLHENKLDVYNVPYAPGPSSSSAASAAPGRNPSADDRLAEQFRRQFYDEQALRRKRRRPVNQQQQRPQPVNNDVLRGPKLGGSRNQRAAVRDILLQQQQTNKGK